MSTPTANQLAIMRRPDQSTELYLAVYQPPVVEHGRVFPDAQIQGLPSDLADNYYISGFTATNVATSGTVRIGQTLVFGSAAGKEDLGRTFVRGHSSNHYDFSVLENMPLVSGIYYRVYDFYELWPVFPRVTVDGSNVITYYKDYDKAYGNQNSVFTPVAVVGPNSAAFVDDYTGQKQMTFVATGSYTIDGTAISNVYWEINTSPATILTGSTVSYTFPSSGHYTIETRVVNANAITGTAHRHYVLLNREGIVRSPYNPPIKDWTFESLDGSWDAGGWQCKFTIGEDSDDVRDGALVIVFAEDVYGNGAPQSFGGYTDRENILFSGYIDKVDNRNDWQGSKATFNAKSAIGLLQNRDMFSVSLETSPNPVDWTQIKDMTINRIIDHYLRWHSTFLDVCDYRPCKNTSSGDYPEQYEDIPRGEIFNNVRNILGNRILANFVSDRQGRVFSEVNLNYIITGSRPSSVLTFQDGDWIGDLKTVEDLEYKTSSVLLGGVSYDSSISTGSAYLSRAPDALFPLHFGKAETKSGMTIDSQSTLNNLCGLYLAGENSRFPSLGMTIANNMRTIDVIPQEFYQLPTSNPFNDQDYRNLQNVWANRRFIPRRMNYTLKNGTLATEIIYETETHGLPGETVRIPAQPPVNGTPEPPDIPGVPDDPTPTEPPGIGEVEWTITTFVGTIYSVDLYGEYVYLCGIDSDSSPDSWRVEKRNKSNGGLVWGYNRPAGVAQATSGYSVSVDADGVFSGGSSPYEPGAFNIASFEVIKLLDADGSVGWDELVPALDSPGAFSWAAFVKKYSTALYSGGRDTTVVSPFGRMESRLASNGSSNWSVNLLDITGLDVNSNDVFVIGLDSSTVPTIARLNTGGSTMDTESLGAAGDRALALKLDDNESYLYIIRRVSGIYYLEKRDQLSFSTIRWQETLPTAITSLPYNNVGIGNSFVFFANGADDLIYEFSKSNGSNDSFSGVMDNPRNIAVDVDNDNIYIVGSDGGNWTVQKRVLSYT